MKSFEATGRTVEDAISSGLAEHGLSIGDVNIEILEEGSKGLFGLFGSRNARIRLILREEEGVGNARELFQGVLGEQPTQKPEETSDPTQKPTEKKTRPARKKQQSKAKPQDLTKAQPKAQPKVQPKEKEAKQPREKKARKPRPPREERSQGTKEAKPAMLAPQADPATPEGQAQQFLQQLTKLMGMEISVSVRTEDDDGHVYATLEGDPQGILIGRRGETLDALQYLTSLHINKGREGYVRVTLDSEGYRQRREEALIRLANRMANRARKTGRRVNMEPMNPYERRIFHSALQANPGVSTHSEGEDPNRHIVITPVKVRDDGDKKEQND